MHKLIYKDYLEEKLRGFYISLQTFHGYKNFIKELSKKIELYEEELSKLNEK